MVSHHRVCHNRFFSFFVERICPAFSTDEPALAHSKNVKKRKKVY